MSIVVNTTHAQSPPHDKESASTGERAAALIQQAYTQQYTEARNQYKASHARFTARVKRPPSSHLEHYCKNVLQDLSFYTSAVNAEEACAPSVCTHGPRRIGIHSLNHELRLRGQRRLRAAPAKRKCDAGDVIALIVEEEAAEYADLQDLEAQCFLEVARTYYITIFGPIDDLVWLEAQARRSFEDEYHRATMVFLAQLREEIWWAEQRLFLRALGMFPDALPHVAQLRLMAAEFNALQQATMSVLDSRDAVPLWQRVYAIRRETENEEDITFRRILLACVVEAHGISDGYLGYDTVTGRLQRVCKEMPQFMQDVVDYSMHFEPFAVILEEETQRMRIAEEVEDACASLVAAVTSGADVEGDASSPLGITTAPVAPNHTVQSAAEV